MSKRFKTATKEGAKITIITTTGYTYVFDFTNQTVTSKKGELKRCPISHLDDYADSMTDGERLLINICLNAHFPDKNLYIMSRYNTIETFLSALDVCPDNMHKLPDENPKGFVKWLREKKLKATLENLNIFKSEKSLKAMSAEVQQKFKFLEKTELFYKNNLIEIGKNPELISNFYSMLKNSFKNFEAVSRLKGDIHYLFSKTNYYDKWDKNRSVTYNYELVLNLENEDKRKSVTEKQNRFKALENIEHENWKIIVPTTIEQLVEEGKQQHNCVGRLYPNIIDGGDTIVYFIREKKALDKSWHTCSAYIKANQKTPYSNQVLKLCNRRGDSEVKKWVKEVVDKKIREIIANFSID